MKILVFSDSHGRAKNIVEALKIHGGVCDFAVFLGDGLKDIDYAREKFPSVPFVSVRGNCDTFFCDSERDECVLDLDGVRVLITHGHKYNVKYGYGTILYRARELEVDAVSSVTPTFHSTLRSTWARKEFTFLTRVLSEWAQATALSTQAAECLFPHTEKFSENDKKTSINA